MSPHSLQPLHNNYVHTVIYTHEAFLQQVSAFFGLQVGIQQRKNRQIAIIVLFFVEYLTEQGRRKPKKHEEGRRKPKKAEEGRRRPKKAEEGRRRPKKAEEGRRRPKKAEICRRTTSCWYIIVSNYSAVVGTCMMIYSMKFLPQIKLEDHPQKYHTRHHKTVAIRITNLTTSTVVCSVK